jgi:hypothetical protein
MAAESQSKIRLTLVLAALVTMAGLVAPVVAQVEPTPVPEPAQEEPQAEPEETEPAEEPEPEQREVPKVFREQTLITIDGRAEMDGFIELVVEPHGEGPVKVRANIVAKTKKKKITKELTDQLVFALGDRYKVKQTGDRTIYIKAKRKVPPVAIILKTQNLAGVSVMIGKG